MWLRHEMRLAKQDMDVVSNVSLFLLVLIIGSVHGHREPAPSRRTPAELIQSNGYASEVHHVTTPDGYVLQLDRIPRPGRPAVYLAHQLFASASSYLLLGKGMAIGFLLHDAGFDVWLGNHRGTEFSLNHTRLSSSDEKFWEFGWHENGAVDNPAMIDYVLRKSGQRDLVYLGHSMGGTTFFVMASERPDVLNKIRAAFLMAPVVFLEYHKSRLISSVQPFTNISQGLVDRLHLQNHPAGAIRNLMKQVSETPLLRRFGSRIVFGKGVEFGTNFFTETSSSQPTILEFGTFYPAQASFNQMVHYFQLADPKWPGFRKFNYGASKNRDRYGTASPPNYKLSHITTPIYMYNGRADAFCTEQDLETLRRNLRSLKKDFLSRNPHSSHVDFVLSNTAATDVWQEVLEDLKQLPWQ